MTALARHCALVMAINYQPAKKPKPAKSLLIDCVLDLFRESEMTTREVHLALPAVDPDVVKMTLTRLVNRGSLTRVQRGVYRRAI